MLERRDLDEYARGKLGLVTGQLARIQAILRELVTFSRPASHQRSRASVRGIVGEALGIAKFYKGGTNWEIVVDLPADLPPLDGIRDQFVQIVFNLVLNAIDATDRAGESWSRRGSRPTAWCSRSRTTATASSRPIGSDRSGRTSRPRSTGRASACSSFGESLKLMAGRSR